MNLIGCNISLLKTSASHSHGRIEQKLKQEGQFVVEPFTVCYFNQDRPLCTLAFSI